MDDITLDGVEGCFVEPDIVERQVRKLWLLREVSIMRLEQCRTVMVNAIFCGHGPGDAHVRFEADGRLLDLIFDLEKELKQRLADHMGE